MKTHIKILLACLVVCGFSMLNISSSNAQCTTFFEYPFGGASLTPGSTGLVTIDFCQFDGDFSHILNATTGATYVVSSTNPDGMVTVHDGSNTGAVIAFGATPFTFVNTGGSDIYLDWSSSGCSEVDFNCETTSIQCIANCGTAPAAPPNDDCSEVTPVTLTNGVPVTFTGNTTGATSGTDGAFSALPTVWEAFTINTCATVTLDYCSTSPAFQDIWINLATSCPANSFVTSFDFSQCSNGNYTITFSSLPAGTYYIPIIASEQGFVTPGPYTLNVTAQACYDPCANVLPANACGVSNFTTIPAGGGFFNGTSIGEFDTPGAEAIYTFTPAATGNYHVTVSSNSFGYYTDFFYKDASLGCDNTNWNFWQDVFPGTTSFTGIPLQAGTTYYVMLDQELFTFGGTVNWQIECPLTPPANDDCANAIPINCGDVVTGTTLAATADGPQFSCGFLNGPDVWYSFTSASPVAVTLSLCGSNYDTELGVFSGTCGSLTQVACNDDFCGSQSQLTFSASPGTTYYINVSGFFGSIGNYTLSVVSCVTPPANDNCANAIPISCGQTVTGSSVGATQDAPNFTCGFANGPDVWYSLTIASPQTVSLRLCGSSYDTEIGVFSGTCGALTQIACNDDFCGVQSGVNFTAPAGTYYIAVSGFFGEVGDYTLSVISCITPPPPPVNDNCSNVTPVVITPGVNVTFTGTTLGATSDANDGIFNTGVPVVWHAFTLTSMCSDLRVEYCGTPPGTLGNVYINLATGCPSNNGFFFNNFENFTCGDGNYTLYYVNVPAGTYYIPVMGEFPGFNTPGPYTVTVVPCPPPPANDVPCGAFAVTCGNNAPSYTNQSCSVDAGEPAPPGGICNDPSGQSWCPFEGGVQHSCWFTFAAPPGSGPGGSSVTIKIASGGSTGLPSFDSQVALWDPGQNGSCSSYTGWNLVWANDDDDVDFLSDGVYIFSSKMVIPAGTLIAGRTYFLQVDGYGGATGQFRVIINCPTAVPPVISCPGDAMICSNGASIGTPTVISSQAPVTFTNNAPAVFPIGIPTVVTWTGTDAYGQTGTCTQTVTRNETPAIVSLQSATLAGGVAQSFPTPPSFLDIPVNTTATTCDKAVNYTVNITGTPNPSEVVGGLTYTFTGATTGSGSGTGSGSTFGRAIPTGRTTVTINATNVCGSVSKQFRVTVTDNVLPVITPIQVPVTNTNGGECSSLVQVTQPTIGNGLFDNCPNASLIFVSRSDGRSQFEPYFAGTTTVTWQATDASANVSTATQNVVVNNIKPVVTSLTSSAGAVIFTNQTTTFTTTFTDEDGGGTHTIKFYRDKNDASPSSIKTLAPSCTQSCTGVRSYTVTSDPILYVNSEVAEPKVEVLDGCNLAADQVPGVTTFQYLAIAVSGTQFTTAGGHFTMPAGGYPAAYVGMDVNMGNVVKKANTGNSYKGQLEMNVHLTPTTNWRVHTDNGTNQDITWDYLTVSGCSLATFKGAVLLNGVSGYKVLVQQADKNQNPATSNFIRVKVTTNSGTVIFDTQPGLTEALTSSNGGAAAIITQLQGGSIKVQPANGCVSRMDDQASDELLQNIPNPFTGQTEIRFNVPEDGKYTLTVYNYLGQEVTTLFNGEATIGTVYSVMLDGSNLKAGIYTYTLRGADMVETRKMNLIK